MKRCNFIKVEEHGQFGCTLACGKYGYFKCVGPNKCKMPGPEEVTTEQPERSEG